MLFLWWVKVVDKLSSLDKLFVIWVGEFGCAMQWIPILGRSPQNLRRILQILEVESFD